MLNKKKKALISPWILSPWILITVLILISTSGCTGNDEPEDPGPPVVEKFVYEVINTYPHDPEAFTQGLAFYDGMLYEGTGMYGRSELRRTDLSTGDWDLRSTVSEEYFGEGITILDDLTYQLTWKGETGFVYEMDSFGRVGTFEYDTEGWGLTTDGENLIMSDGTAVLTFLDPGDFDVVKTLRVRYQGEDQGRLNELEYIDGMIYANVWKENRILIISPTTGHVTGDINMTGLMREGEVYGGEDVLNGIAYDTAGDRLFVTGKLWANLFEIEVIPI